MMRSAKLSVTREDVVDFLYTEARLLDDWRLDEWLLLFTPESRYCVPPAGAGDNADPAELLFFVNDDYFLISERVARLKKSNAHAEFPHSMCRRIVSNVQILGGADSCFDATSNFITYRTKAGKSYVFPGHHNYQLRVSDGEIKILKKTSFVDVEDLYEQGKVSIII